MGFTFSLIEVLEHRQVREEEAQREYGLAMAALSEARSALDTIQEDVTARSGQIRRAMIAGITLPERELWEGYIQSRISDASQAGEAVLRADQLAQAKRNLLVKAMQQREILEKLREDERRAWERMEASAELKRFDEIAVRAFSERLREQWDDEACVATGAMRTEPANSAG